MPVNSGVISGWGNTSLSLCKWSENYTKTQKMGMNEMVGLFFLF
jgi:hypothetical protein